MTKDPSENLLKIGDVARTLGVSIDTIRRWEKTGKISPFRTTGDTRLYSPFLKISDAAKFLGVSIDTIRRWEKTNRISPIRTPAGTRLYLLEQLKNVKYGKVEKPVQPPSTKA
ncbi:MAG: Uncharacterized protein G01um101493_23, partial [Microgenomates group bacterium Gr01-1014_93]